MEHGPDIVTFAKKMLTGGIYHNKEHRPKQAARIMNTWVGDPHKVLMLKEVKKLRPCLALFFAVVVDVAVIVVVDVFIDFL